MALIDTPPHIRLLEAAKTALEGVDFNDRAGMAMTTVRHARNRRPLESELPCISIRWIGNEDHNPDDQYKTAGERVRRCNIDLEIELKIPDEESGQDSTAWLLLGRVGAAAFEAINDEDGALRQLCDWVTDVEDQPDEDSKPDEGRLVKAIYVVYRVRSEAPNVLLAVGENEP